MRWTILVAMLPTLAACVDQAVEERERLIAEAQDQVRSELRDPESAEFRNVAVFDRDVVCGEYNSRNGYGGYVGFAPFVVLSDEVAAELDAERQARIDRGGSASQEAPTGRLRLGFHNHMNIDAYGRFCGMRFSLSDYTLGTPPTE